MPKSCCVPGCNSNKRKNQDLKFYIIPSERSRRDRWLNAISRAKLNPDGSINKGKRWSPKSGQCYVCSSHFITGVKVNDSTHPDYVPSIFPSTTTSRQDDGKEMSK
ncbi:hypothetical protein CHS0354_023460 [Potamilus streckersoni]|uniref:THAP-type domain-containing protein n=1 Tax=Potamilus streckersoni TaxID=2493646 RepID=A0AAE0S4P1_9BIVA|nr:hypothetical protein CHS0354_023460 [Potamilus streckersoni]